MNERISHRFAPEGRTCQQDACRSHVIIEATATRAAVSRGLCMACGNVV